MIAMAFARRERYHRSSLRACDDMISVSKGSSGSSRQNTFLILDRDLLRGVLKDGNGFGQGLLSRCSDECRRQDGDKDLFHDYPYPRNTEGLVSATHYQQLCRLCLADPVSSTNQLDGKVVWPVAGFAEPWQGWLQQVSGVTEAPGMQLLAQPRPDTPGPSVRSSLLAPARRTALHYRFAAPEKKNRPKPMVKTKSP